MHGAAAGLLRPLDAGLQTLRARVARQGAGLFDACIEAGHALRRGDADRHAGRGGAPGCAPWARPVRDDGRQGACASRARCRRSRPMAIPGHAAAPHGEHGRRHGQRRSFRHRGPRRPASPMSTSRPRGCWRSRRRPAGPADLELVPEDRAAARWRSSSAALPPGRSAGVRGTGRPPEPLDRGARLSLRRRPGRAPARRDQRAASRRSNCACSKAASRA